MDTYEQYEKECKAIRQENVRLLEEFAVWLQAKSLATSTVEKHVGNIDFFVNEFLLYEDPQPAAEGAPDIGMFLGYWFIRKAMWASQASIRSNAASLKKFYRFMFEQGRVAEGELDLLKATIKDEMPDWLETLSRYDDPSIEDPGEVWGY